MKFKRNKAQLTENLGSREEWKGWWESYGSYRLRPGNHLWLCGGDEVHVHSIDGVNESLIEPVVEGAQSLLDDAGMVFRAIDKGYNADLDCFIKSWMEHSKIDTYIGDEINDRRQESGNTHADIVLMPFHLYQGKSCPTWAWGAGCHVQGCAFIYLPGDRQEDRNRDFIRKVAKHETWHLLTGPEHTHVYGVEGYDDVPDCITLPGCSTMDICEKCMDALKSYWKSLEANMGKKYFR